MLSPAMLRILRWLDEHPSTLEGHGMCHVAFPRRHRRRNWCRTFSTVSTHVCFGGGRFLLTRQAHVIGGGRRKRKVVHITESGRNQLHSHKEDIPERRARSSSKLKGQLPEYTHVHGRHSELGLIRDALETRCQYTYEECGIGKSTLARRVAEDLIEKDLNVHWVQLDAYCDVHEAMKRMEADASQILDVEGYASSFQHENVIGV